MEPIGKANLSKEVMKAILETIRNDQFKPGERLPPIKELSNKLEVGISSIREGLKQLQSMGIIEIVQGKGTFVSENLGLDQYLSNFENLITLQKQEFLNVMERIFNIICAIRIEPDTVYTAFENLGGKALLVCQVTHRHSPLRPLPPLRRVPPLQRDPPHPRTQNPPRVL